MKTNHRTPKKREMLIYWFLLRMIWWYLTICLTLFKMIRILCLKYIAII